LVERDAVAIWWYGQRGLGQSALEVGRAPKRERDEFAVSLLKVEILEVEGKIVGAVAGYYIP
jgi:hypothetical protein